MQQLLCNISWQAGVHVRAAEDGEEAFTTGMVTSAAHVIRQLCTDKPDEGKVIFLLSMQASISLALALANTSMVYALSYIAAASMHTQAPFTICGIGCRHVVCASESWLHASGFLQA